ncbi:hypothetical protein GCM10025879_17820 [Leuconostoc litchii]|uniref:hypothetical protein n=1 Tax=Leuconostoc litchii TaxID=1981069 RepID=UPI0023E9EBC8|nr:hypothetical protein [Leuconostoc litchii]GMA70536.1 hypothetical protein GCM10025879_17820 [Leuconostoc litchii]
MNSDSYVTISFSNDMGIPVDKHNEDEYYVLGPKNNTSKSNIFIGVNGHQEKKVFYLIRGQHQALTACYSSFLIL